MNRGLIATVLGSGLRFGGGRTRSADMGDADREISKAELGHAVTADFVDLASTTQGDGVELRLDAWAAAWARVCGELPGFDDVKYLIAQVRDSCSKPLLSACPDISSGATSGAAPELSIGASYRFDLLLGAARAGCDWVDVDVDSASAFFARLDGDSHGGLGDAKVLLSSHFSLDEGDVGLQLDGQLDELLAVQQTAKSVRGIKLVGHGGEDGAGERGLALLTWLRESRQRWRGRDLIGVVFAGGESGTFTRTLAPALGSDFIFAAADGGRRVPGQVTVTGQLERWPRGYPRDGARLFGVLGYPVAASLSPQLFTALFRHHHIDAVYGRLEVQEPAAAFAFLELPEVTGLSVTSPHKASAHKFAQGQLASDAVRLGAVNTLGRIGEGASSTDANLGVTQGVPDVASSPSSGASSAEAKWWGANTDVDGVRLALGLGPAGLPPGQAAVVLGAGGAARAVLGALTGTGTKPQESGRVIVLARRPKAALALAREFGASVAGPGDALAPDLLIHTTPAGSHAQPGALPLAEADLERIAQAAPHCIVLDAIYSPHQTPLLARAAALGLETRNGLDWFLGQGLAQFQRFTGQPAAPDVARSTVLQNLARPWIALTGLRAVGKSTVGALLAKRLDLAFVDLDQEIAREAGTDSPGQLLQTRGEAHFRKVEAATLERILAKRDCEPGVLATGGGVVETSRCRALLGADRVWCALLTAPSGQLDQRAAGDSALRPTLASLGAGSESQAAWDRRGGVLEELADARLDTSGMDPAEVARMIELALPQALQS